MLLGAPGLTSSNKKLLVTKGIAANGARKLRTGRSWTNATFESAHVRSLCVGKTVRTRVRSGVLLELLLGDAPVVIQVHDAKPRPDSELLEKMEYSGLLISTCLLKQPRYWCNSRGPGDFFEQKPFMHLFNPFQNNLQPQE